MFLWFSQNSGIFSAVLPAAIAAIVALLVFALTQYVSYKRDRTQFLAPKLEELYLLLNETGEDNVRFFKLVARASIGEKEAQDLLNSMEESSLYGLNRAKHIVMYVRLYFPELTNIHVSVFHSQQIFNALTYRALSDDPPEIEELVDAIGDVSHYLMLMEDEIIRNRDVLLRDHLLLKNYDVTTEQAKANKRSAPEAGIFENLIVEERSGSESQ